MFLQYMLQHQKIGTCTLKNSYEYALTLRIIYFWIWLWLEKYK